MKNKVNKEILGGKNNEKSESGKQYFCRSKELNKERKVRLLYAAAG